MGRMVFKEKERITLSKLQKEANEVIIQYQAYVMVNNRHTDKQETPEISVWNQQRDDLQSSGYENQLYISQVQHFGT